MSLISGSLTRSSSRRSLTPPLQHRNGIHIGSFLSVRLQYRRMPPSPGRERHKARTPPPGSDTKARRGDKDIALRSPSSRSKGNFPCLCFTCEQVASPPCESAYDAVPCPSPQAAKQQFSARHGSPGHSSENPNSRTGTIPSNRSMATSRLMGAFIVLSRE